ncbi:radical SAM/SPASM domain-containing protein [Cobetia sp. Ld8]|uniref:radical SAM protein n=1 Tax=Cobetia sp. Ld8 TaxID=649154 RepID=UPI00386561F0
MTHKFWRITLDTNPDFCNLKCVMCEDHSPYAASLTERKKNGLLRPTMDTTLLEKVVREAAQLGVREVIPSTMGEPLLYPHFDVFLALCSELGLTLNLTTNGTFPAPKSHQNVEYWARKIVPITSDVKISWNGVTERTQSTIMGGTSLEQHIDNAKRFIEIRDELQSKNYCSMTMQLTFMRSNLEEIPDLLDLALSLGFDRLKGHQLWTHFDEIRNESLRNDLVYAARWNQIVQHCHERVATHNQTAKRPFRLENFFALDLAILEDISPDGECPFLGKELWVDPTGRLNVCCAPDQQRKTLGDFGNLNTAKLSELVEGESYQELMNTYQSHALCQSCNMRRPK